MKRKVIQIAGSTMLVSLPRKWAKKYEIQKGDELEIDEYGHKLTISATSITATKKTSIDITGLDRDSILYLLRGVYTQGFDEIELLFDSPSAEDFRRKKKRRVLDIIDQEISRLQGVEIFSQSTNKCIIKSISLETEKEFVNLFNRILFLMYETIEEFIVAYESGDKDTIENIDSKHDLISKFVYYCERILSKGAYNNVNKIKTLANILNYLDLCMDTIKYSARLVLKNPHLPSAETIVHFREVLEQFNAFRSLYTNFKLEGLKEMNSKMVKSINGFEKLMEGKSPEETKVISYINTFLENFRFLIFNAVKINYSVE